jgi:cytosine/adenosine deaminase-related metal-dependent hydrolase
MNLDNNLRIAKKYYEKPLGRLVEGAFADLIIVDYQPPTPISAENLNSHILFGISGRAVDTTVINGRVVMENRRLTLLEEEEVFARSRELAEKVWERV